MRTRSHLAGELRLEVRRQIHEPAVVVLRHARIEAQRPGLEVELPWRGSGSRP
jgi:hypothetical protein